MIVGRIAESEALGWVGVGVMGETGRSSSTIGDDDEGFGRVKGRTSEV